MLRKFCFTKANLGIFINSCLIYHPLGETNPQATHQTTSNSNRFSDNVSSGRPNYSGGGGGGYKSSNNSGGYNNSSNYGSSGSYGSQSKQTSSGTGGSNTFYYGNQPSSQQPTSSNNASATKEFYYGRPPSPTDSTPTVTSSNQVSNSKVATNPEGTTPVYQNIDFTQPPNETLKVVRTHSSGNDFNHQPTNNNQHTSSTYINIQTFYNSVQEGTYSDTPQPSTNSSFFNIPNILAAAAATSTVNTTTPSIQGNGHYGSNRSVTHNDSSHTSAANGETFEIFRALKVCLIIFMLS